MTHLLPAGATVRHKQRARGESQRQSDLGTRPYLLHSVDLTTGCRVEFARFGVMATTRSYGTEQDAGNQAPRAATFPFAERLKCNLVKSPRV